MRKIETKEELIEHITRVSSAYRKSYKFYGIINRLLQITGGIVGSTAVLAMCLLFLCLFLLCLLFLLL